MRRGSVSRYVIFAISVATLSSLAFSCNLFTGPHNSSGPDTTSGNFAWTVDTIGASGSYLYDVTIVNDSLAYAVGLLMPSDSVGRNNTNYWDNAAVWNGTKWTPMQVPLYYQGQKTFSTAYSVFGRNESDIWFGMGYLEHWDGHQFIQVDPQLGSVENKIWESSDGSQLYVVGNYGKISYSPDHGSTWQQVQTGTTLPFQDIWGDGEQVLAMASDKFGSGGQYIVELNGNVAMHIQDTVHASLGLSGIWFLSNEKYFIVGNGIYEADSVMNGGSWDGPFVPLNWFSFAVRGQATNDVIVAGESASISHFNGKRWTGFSSLLNTSVRLQSVAIKNNLVIAGGFIHNDAQRLYYGVAYVGRR